MSSSYDRQALPLGNYVVWKGMKTKHHILSSSTHRHFRCTCKLYLHRFKDFMMVRISMSDGSYTWHGKLRSRRYVCHRDGFQHQSVHAIGVVLQWPTFEINEQHRRQILILGVPTYSFPKQPGLSFLESILLSDQRVFSLFVSYIHPHPNPIHYKRQ